MLTSNKYIASYSDGQNLPITAEDDEEAAWVAKDIAVDKDTPLINIIPIHDC